MSRVVLITGANSGVGFATAKVIARASKDYHVIMASRSPEKGQAALSELANEGGITGTLSTVQLDVTDETSITQAVAHVEKKFGKLDVLINNAGVASRHDDIRTRLQLCMDTNVIGPAVVASKFRPLLLRAPRPYSIYVGSGVGSLTLASDPSSKTYHGPSNGEAYRASKAALNMIMVQEFVETADTPLTVFGVCPGFVRSNLRGTSEEARSGWGHAGNPETSGQTILDIIEGHRDAEAGKLVHKDGFFPW